MLFPINPAKESREQSLKHFTCNVESCVLDIRGLIAIFHAETADDSTLCYLYYQWNLTKYFGVTWYAFALQQRRVLRLLHLIHTCRTYSHTPDLTEWKSETENWKIEFSIRFKKSVAYIFNVLNMTSTNIDLYSFYEE